MTSSNKLHVHVQGICHTTLHIESLESCQVANSFGEGFQLVVLDIQHLGIKMETRQ